MDQGGEEIDHSQRNIADNQADFVWARIPNRITKTIGQPGKLTQMDRPVDQWGAVVHRTQPAQFSPSELPLNFRIERLDLLAREVRRLQVGVQTCRCTAAEAQRDAAEGSRGPPQGHGFRPVGNSGTVREGSETVE